MSRVIAQFTDDDGYDYVVLDDLDDDDDPRNAPPRRYHPSRQQQSSSSAPRPAPRSARAVPLQTTQGAPRRHHRSESVQMLPTRQPMTPKTAKVLDFVEVFTDGVAELIPLPDKPPPPTGETPTATDIHNQNEHREALHAHRVLTSRIRTSGRVISKVFRLLLDD